MFGLILVVHIFSAIYWMGGVLMITNMLARVPEEVGLPKERFLGAARQLFEVSTNVGAAITVISGIGLVVLRRHAITEAWLDLKFVAVAVMLFYHVRFIRRLRYLEDNPSQITHEEYNFIHAAVSLLLFVIVLLSVYGAGTIRLPIPANIPVHL
ncbi:MAG TPA: CopD family protein [Candidatus Binataceae bacterium]|nr:CopD family protein [Candidatus Binataceae bacterium]